MDIAWKYPQRFDGRAIADCGATAAEGFEWGSRMPIERPRVLDAILKVVRSACQWRVLQENVDPRFTTCRDGRFLKNVVAFRAGEMREAVNIGGSKSPQSFAFAGNHWACLDRPADAQRYVRLPVADPSPRFGAPPAFADAEQGDLTIDPREPSGPGVRARE